MVKGTWNIILTHTIGWLIFLSLPAVFIFSNQPGDTLFDYGSVLHWSLFTVYIAIFYLHTYWIFPAFLIPKKYLAYAALMSIMLLAVMLLQPFDKVATIKDRHESTAMMPPAFDRSLPAPAPGHLRPPMDHRPGMRMRPVIDIVSLALFILIIALSFALSLESIRQKAVAKAAAAEAEKATAELALLKAQINPHFLFNTLNNIYSLALMQDEHTADSILKFANIMRYVTDEIPGEKVLLDDEIKCIKDYIDLQRLRVTAGTAIIFECNGDTSSKLIAPLILITFVENAFKYGVSNTINSAIKILITATGDSIDFVCENNIVATTISTNKGGVGIANTKKRLEHLYPGRHQLTITQTDSLFRISLNIKL